MYCQGKLSLRGVWFYLYPEELPLPYCKGYIRLFEMRRWARSLHMYCGLNCQIALQNAVMFYIVYVIYIPPEGSLYYNDSALVEIQSELDSLSDKYTSICLLGDWNARTKLLQDYIEPDQELFHENNLLDMYEDER